MGCLRQRVAAEDRAGVRLYLATFSLGNTVKPLGTVLLNDIVVSGPIVLKVASGETTIMNLLRVS